MPQDEMFVPSRVYFGKELYGDTLYQPEKERLPFDKMMFSPGTQFPADAQGFTPSMPVSSAVDFERFNTILNRDPIFYTFCHVDWLTFAVGLNLGSSTDFISSEYATIAVEKDYIKGTYNAMAQTRACLFIPFHTIDLDNTGARLINKVYIYNKSNPDNVIDITGTFRYPVAITRNTEHLQFDHSNTAVYNQDWWYIKMAAAANNFIQKK